MLRAQAVVGPPVLDETEVVLYIDADMCVYAPLTEVAEQARHAAVVLSPHSLAPRTDPRMPDDERCCSSASSTAASSL